MALNCILKEIGMFLIPTGIILGSIIIPIGITTGRKNPTGLHVCTHGKIQKEPVLELPAVAKCDQCSGAAGEGQIGWVIGMQTERKCGNDIEEDKPSRCYVRCE